MPPDADAVRVLPQHVEVSTESTYVAAVTDDPSGVLLRAPGHEEVPCEAFDERQSQRGPAAKLRAGDDPVALPRRDQAPGFIEGGLVDDDAVSTREFAIVEAQRAICG